MVANGLAVVGSTEVNVEDEFEEAGCGRPEWKVWISDEKVMMAGDVRGGVSRLCRDE
jgi:hypothetical protein